MKLGTLTPSFRLGSTTPSRIYLGTNLVWESVDSDAADYFARITAAGSTINDTNKAAVNAFIVGCKADGIWSAIKASCILAGADTLAGALVPLVGAAPTNFDFVAGDYLRTTGLLGNGSTKYLNSNRNNNAEPQNSRHMAVWRTASESRTATMFALATANGTGMGQLATTTNLRISRSAGGDYQLADTSASAGFWGHSRSNGTQITQRYAGSSSTGNFASQAPLNENLQLFARSAANFSNARMSFYSIGESLDLALLDARLTTLMSSLT